MDRRLDDVLNDGLVREQVEALEDHTGPQADLAVDSSAVGLPVVGVNPQVANRHAAGLE